MISSIQTSSLTLRRFEPKDAGVLYRIYQTEGILRYFPATTPAPLERVERFIANQHEHWEKYGYGNWGIVPKGESQIVGWAGLQFLPELNETEVGYLLDKPFWGKGSPPKPRAHPFNTDSSDADWITSSLWCIRTTSLRGA